jgi:hypothetical protein
MENRQELERKLAYLSEEYYALEKEQNNLSIDPEKNSERIAELDKLMESKNDEIIDNKKSLENYIDGKSSFSTMVDTYNDFLKDESDYIDFRNPNLIKGVEVGAKAGELIISMLGSSIQEDRIKAIDPIPIYSEQQQVNVANADGKIESLEEYVRNTLKEAFEEADKGIDLLGNSTELPTDYTNLDSLLDQYKTDYYKEAYNTDSTEQGKEKACEKLVIILENQSENSPIAIGLLELGQSYENRASELLKEQYGEVGIEKFNAVNQNLNQIQLGPNHTPENNR